MIKHASNGCKGAITLAVSQPNRLPGFFHSLFRESLRKDLRCRQTSSWLDTISFCGNYLYHQRRCSFNNDLRLHVSVINGSLALPKSHCVPHYLTRSSCLSVFREAENRWPRGRLCDRYRTPHEVSERPFTSIYSPRQWMQYTYCVHWHVAFSVKLSEEVATHVKSRWLNESASATTSSCLFLDD